MTRNREEHWTGGRLLVGLLIALSMACVGMLEFRMYWTGQRRFLFINWNLFLAWLPYIAAVLAVLSSRFIRFTGIRRAAILLFGIGWLLFFPNSPYLTTDLIHLVYHSSSYVSQGEVMYLVWYDITLLFLFSWCGLFLGFLSTYPFHRMVAERFGEWVGWGFVAAVSVLGGYGVFLGRVVRLNSWDIVFNPFFLAGEILGNVHFRGFSFTLLFGAFLFVIYVFLYALQEKKR